MVWNVVTRNDIFKINTFLEFVMKILHCADLHLDSVMNTHFTIDKAKDRKAEILDTFCNMVKYAADNGVNAIIIAGDLYDKRNISATARNTVFCQITGHPEIIFYYLKGNHDAESFLDGMKDIPANLKMFENEWTSYIVGEEYGRKIVITGVELTNNNDIYNSLVLRTEDFNIVVLHGQETKSASKDTTKVISLKDLKNKNIDYLALGHVHSYKEGCLDSRGVYCYSGCLEGRGFDECGEHGFVMLDIDVKNNSFKREFVNIAKRNIYSLEVDITGCVNSMEISDRIWQIIKEKKYDRRHLVKIILTGDVDVECEKNEEFLNKHFENEFYCIKIKDESRLMINYDDFMYDESLKGEFVRTVKADLTLTDEEKATVIRYGIQALKGEELQ